MTAALAALGVAASATVSSGAFFNSADRERSVATSGTVRIELGGDAPRTAGLRPGEQTPRSGTVRLSNSGSLPAAITFDPSAAAQGGLGTALRLQVDDCGGSPACTAPDARYDGTLASAPPIALSPPLQPGDERFVRLRLSWPAANADPSLYGTRVEPTFKWIARSLGSS